ncbi:poly-gamma-glutamate biosynthesis protein PgsC [bacterium]|nr:MAG: poly-gamma-glutamate biosynthesis protein PgsC [bacterium]
MLWISVGLGLVISLLFAEWLGLTAGGLVVPGYIALFWDKPLQIVGTLLAAFIALILLKIISTKTFVYGRRRLVLTILLGFIFGSLLRFIGQKTIPPHLLSFDPIGYVIPGLLAYWMEKQGIIETITGLIIASVIVRMAIILINGGMPIDITWF